ncbi:MAG: BlaI/MecI/CopY family transcriptional regulator [bacterium]|nr:BlaI/MecI/CopY family transcriptional regulator [bacterium]
MAKRSKQPKPSGLSSGQIEIMNVVWDRGEVTVGEVREVLDANRNTIQTTMVRLEEKGWLTHRTVGQTFVYTAAHPRDSALGQMVSQLVDTAFQGSAAGLVQTLLSEGDVTDAEVQRIEKMIREARKSQRRRS